MGDGSLAFAPQWLKASQTNLRSGTQGGASSSKGNLTVMLLHSFIRWWTLWNERRINSAFLIGLRRWRILENALVQNSEWLQQGRTARTNTLHVMMESCWRVHLPAQQSDDRFEVNFAWKLCSFLALLVSWSYTLQLEVWNSQWSCQLHHASTLCM